MSFLVLVRHGQSEWNEKNLFTGFRDPDLTAKGKKEAEQAGKLLKDKEIKFDIAFTSALKRAQDSLKIILTEMNQAACPTTKDQALNERDYGALAGMSKDDARTKFGADQVHQWRRSYTIRPPEGESLEDTKNRVLPYYQKTIEPLWQAGKKILVSAHGNSLRALIMFLENLSPEEIIKIEIATGAPLIYAQESGTIKKL